MNILSGYIIAFVWALLFFLAISHILYQKRSPAGMISWILAIAFLPFIAVPLYFVLGVRKRRSAKMKDYVEFSKIIHDKNLIPDKLDSPINAILKKNGIPQATEGNDYELILTPTAAYEKMLYEI